MAFQPGDKVIVQHQFKGQKQEDLRCEKEEILTVERVISSDPNWICCSNSDKNKGLVPVNHVKHLTPKLSEPWFRESMTRKQVERELKSGVNGDFLVRTSEKYPGDYTLCVLFDGTVQFYHVESYPQGFTLDNETYFEVMSDLIHHYQQDADGLVCKLTSSTLEINGKTIQEKDIKFGQKIGCGEFSEVFHGTYNNQQVAIKRFKKSAFSNDLFVYEAGLMENLKHENLVRFIDASIVGDYVCIITEYMENGSLVNYLRSRGRSIIKHPDQLKFSLDSCKGMTYLEEHCLVHRDLAARNILLSSTLQAKVSDFGLAKESDEHANQHHNNNSNHNNNHRTSPNTETQVMTNELQNIQLAVENESKNANRIPVKWTAPEALNTNKYSTKSDVWSFGILLWEIYSYGRTPYPRIYANDVKQYVLSGQRMDCPEGTPKEMYDLMLQCWNLNPDKRPKFTELCNILKLAQSKLPVVQ